MRPATVIGTLERRGPDLVLRLPAEQARALALREGDPVRFRVERFHDG